MIDLRRYKDDAKYLSSCIVTNWVDYDFSEKSEDVNRRIPHLVFDRNYCDVEVNERTPEYVQGFGYEKFIRRYEVTYRDAHYLFVATVFVPFGCVQNYSLDVFLITGNQRYRMLSERL